MTGDRKPVTGNSSRRAALIDLLTAHRPVDPAERGYRMRMLDLAAVAHDPYAPDEYAPGHFTASGFVVHPAGDRILLVHHERLGRWLQPGGHVEPDDPGPMQAAAREIREETGLDSLRPVAAALLDVDVHEFPASGEAPGHLHLDLRFGFVAAHDVVHPLDGARDVRWATPTDFAALGVDRSIIRPAAKLLGG